jgi:hypothetical protein
MQVPSNRMRSGPSSSRRRLRRLRRIAPWAATVLATGLLMAPVSSISATPEITCTVVPDTPSITISQWNSSSGWKSLRGDKGSRSQIVGVRLTTNNAIPAGDVVNVLEDWAPSDIRQTAPAGPWFGLYVALPKRENRTLQISIDNPSQQAQIIDIMLCTLTDNGTPTTGVTPPTTGVTPPTTGATPPTTGTTPLTTTVLPPTTLAPVPTGPVDSQPLKAALPPLSAQSTQYSNLRNAVATNLQYWGDAANLATHADEIKFSWIKAHPAPPSAACIDMHDRYWTYGPDGKAYNSWHPASAFLASGERCDFGHEHGLDPRQSTLFAEFGGMPPFGYVLEQHHNDHATHSGGQHRHEDHVGHKVSLSNNWEAAYGNSAGPKRMYAAGYTCSFISKIHQGSHSDDAFTNNLHEYFITVRCNDGGKVRPTSSGVSTFFSAKMMVAFGRPNEFKDMNIGSPGTDDIPAEQGGKKIQVNGQIIGLSGAPLMLAPAIGPLADQYPSSPNNREFTSPSGWEWKDFSVTRQASPNSLSQIDLWSQIINIESPSRVGQTDKGGIRFGAYYIVKNPVRYYDNTRKGVFRTINRCYNGQNKANLLICAPAPATPTAWNSAASPFNGTFRAVNFKALRVQNEGGAQTWCTNVFGREPTDATANGTACANPAHILQRASTVDNLADNADPGPNARCHPQHPEACGIAGSTVNADVGSDGGFDPQGLGFELIVDQRSYGGAGDDPRLSGPKVIYGEN